MSLCFLLEEGLALGQPNNSYTMMHMGGTGCGLSNSSHLWHLVGNIWPGGPNELHQSVCMVLHFAQFCIQR